MELNCPQSEHEIHNKTVHRKSIKCTTKRSTSRHIYKCTQKSMPKQIHILSATVVAAATIPSPSRGVRIQSGWLIASILAPLCENTSPGHKQHLLIDTSPARPNRRAPPSSLSRDTYQCPRTLVSRLAPAIPTEIWPAARPRSSFERQHVRWNRCGRKVAI